jgi:rhamnosyltransferase subunit B
VRFVLLPLGTYGDVKPFLEIGLRLKGRGHQVILATAEPFREMITSSGLDFASILTAEQHAQFLLDPALWDRRKFFHSFARSLIIPSMRPILELVRNLKSPQEIRLVSAFSGSIGARLAQEVTGAKMLSVWLDPASIRSCIQPPVISGLEFLPSIPFWLRKVVYWFADRSADRLLAPPLNRIRRDLGMKPVHSVLQWMVSEQGSICLFPDWYAARQSDWPPNSTLVGFPTAAPEALPDDVRTYLNQGPPPVVLTFGTGYQQVARQVEVALHACQKNQQRAIVAAPEDARLPSTLPAGTGVFHHRPLLAALLPFSRAIIHHGGIGTVVQSLTSGTPQLAVTMAHDQPDNAARILRLGVGMGISQRDFSERQAESLLSRVLSPTVQQRCREVADLLSKSVGVELACPALEAI